MVQWLSVCLPMQRTRVLSLIQEDLICLRATPASWTYWAHVPRACLRNKRRHLNEKLAHHNKGRPSLTATRESSRSTKDPAQPKISKKKKKVFLRERYLYHNHSNFLIFLESLLPANRNSSRVEGGKNLEIETSLLCPSLKMLFNCLRDIHKYSWAESFTLL